SRQSIFCGLRLHCLQSMEGLESFFGMFGQSQTDVLEKLDRPDQLIFQIGISQFSGLFHSS
ncbi:TPA: hypothetical protein I7785_13490, partial [Vibrio vulnificus]|nr:hypothetical protein [Vibrio vulnificus]